ncbi:MAG: YceD family protein [Acidimicrobiales bacterium]
MAAALAGQFDVALRGLRDARGMRRHELRRGRLLEAVVADIDSRVAAGTEVVVDVVLEAFDGGVEVVGNVSCSWQGECRRCLAEIDGELSVAVREIFRPGGNEEEGTYPMRDDHLDLSAMVLDALFAGLPLMPLCKEDCRGICPHCGADRNVEPCECDEAQVDPRWAGLSVLSERETN